MNLAATPAASVYTLDTFDNSESLADWRVTGDASFAVGPGYRGNGAKIKYRVDGEHPVIITRRLTPATPKLRKATVSLWARFPGNVQVTLEVKDVAGNSILVPLEATLEHPRTGEWLYGVHEVNNRVAELALSVRSRIGATVQGELDCDEIILSRADKAFRLQDSGRFNEPARSGSELPPVGVNIHLLRDEKSLDLAREAGFSFVRFDLLWRNVERRGRFRFFAYDLLLRSLESRGMGVLWILDYGHPDHGGDVPKSPEDLQAFSQFARAAAEHYRGRNVRYEIWNEPNNPQFWAGTPNPAEYHALLASAVAAMRSADPTAIISSGGISNLDLGYLKRILDPDLVSHLNAISVHPYPTAGPESIAPAYSLLRDWIDQEWSRTAEVWESEWGYSSTISDNHSTLNGQREHDRERQANLAVRQILTVWSLGFPLSVWYDLRDDGSDPANPEQNYGLLDANGGEKLAMQAVRNLMASARSRKFTAMLPDPPPGLHGMRLEGATDKLLIIWADDPKNDEIVECPRENFISARDIMGRPVQPSSRSKEYLRFRVSERAGPIYLQCRKGSG